MNEFKKYIPTIIRASIFNVIFSSFRGRRGIIMLVLLLAFYFLNAEFNWFDI